MAWLIGIICVILIVIFWRISLPIFFLAVAGIGIWLLSENAEREQRESMRAKAAQESRQKIEEARNKIERALAQGGETHHTWKVTTQEDPASGEEVPRNAWVSSDGNLCKLQVEQRLNGTRLTALYCPDIRVLHDEDIELKFDNRDTSDKMQISKFSDSESTYIQSYQKNYSGYLSYDDMLQRMSNANKVAIRLTVEGGSKHWIRFSLSDSRPALVRIGAIAPPARAAAANPELRTNNQQHDVNL